MWSPSDGSDAGSLLDGFDDGDADDFADFERGLEAEGRGEENPVFAREPTYGDVPVTTSEPGTPTAVDTSDFRPDRSGSPAWFSSFTAPKFDDDPPAVAASPAAAGSGRRYSGGSFGRRRSSDATSAGRRIGSFFDSFARRGSDAGGAAHRRRRSSVSFAPTSDAPVDPEALSHGSQRASRRGSIDSLGEVDALDDWDPDAFHVAGEPGDDDDDAVPHVIHDDTRWAEDGLVFGRLPPCPPDADAAYYLDEDFVEAAVAAHEARLDSIVAPPTRRYFEDVDRAAKAEEDRVARAEDEARRQAEEDAAAAASPLASSIRSSQVFASIGRATAALRATRSLGGAASPLSRQETRGRIDGGGLPRAGTHRSSLWRSPSPASSEDSLDRWRKTVTVPPRTPTPPPASPAGEAATADVTPVVVRTGSDDALSSPRGFLLGRPPGSPGAFLPAIPRSPRELLDSHHALAALRPSEIEALLDRGVICRATFSAGTTFAVQGAVSVPSHVLICISGAVEVRNGAGACIGRVGAPGHSLLEVEARSVIVGQQRPSVATLAVAAGSTLDAWCLPLELYRRATGLSRAVSRAVSRLSRMESRLGDAGLV